MNSLISVIIPNRNGAGTIRRCLEAVCSSSYDNYEVIVVDDASEDESVDIIREFPCTLVQIDNHSGAACARNRGALRSSGDILFFIDADCLVREDTLALVNYALQSGGTDIIGGTYTMIPADPGFFSTFQSIFVHYSETKRLSDPDYVATHAMAIRAETFRASGGFREDFLPIIEDVEFSHRLKKAGYRLAVWPGLEVRHIFNFTLAGSLRNAFRKSLYWTMYSLGNRDILADSGTASAGLKTNVAVWALLIPAVVISVLTRSRTPLLFIPLLSGFNILVNRGLFSAFFRAGGTFFALSAVMYYMFIYPLPVCLGAVAGAARYLLMKIKKAG